MEAVSQTKVKLQRARLQVMYLDEEGTDLGHAVRIALDMNDPDFGLELVTERVYNDQGLLIETRYTVVHQHSPR